MLTRLLVVALLLMCVAPRPSNAAGFITITGVVVDESGAPVADAVVTINPVWGMPSGQLQ